MSSLSNSRLYSCYRLSLGDRSHPSSLHVLQQSVDGSVSESWRGMCLVAYIGMNLFHCPYLRILHRVATHFIYCCFSNYSAQGHQHIQFVAVFFLQIGRYKTYIQQLCQKPEFLEVTSDTAYFFSAFVRSFYYHHRIMERHR